MGWARTRDNKTMRGKRKEGREGSERGNEENATGVGRNGGREREGVPLYNPRSREIQAVQYATYTYKGRKHEGLRAGPLITA